MMNITKKRRKKNLMNTERYNRYLEIEEEM